MTDLLARSVVVAMITVVPWLFGGVQASVQVWLFAGTAVALGCWLIRCLSERSAGTLPPMAVVPLVGMLALAAVHLVPLQTETRARLSPGGAELADARLADQSSAESSLAERVGVADAADRQPLSLYPASTRRDLALLVLAAAMFVLGAGLFRTSRAQIWLCVAIAVNGAALAFFGLVQQLTWNGLLYWSVPLTGGGGPFGPLVNRNNAGGLLGLCLAGAVGMTVWALGRRGPDRLRTDTPRRWEGPVGARAWRRLLDSLARLDALTIVALCLVALILAGIVCTLSRGTWLATIGAAGLTTLLVIRARPQRFRLRGLALAATAGLLLVGWVGMSTTVHARAATLLDHKTVTQARIPHWRDGLKAAADFRRLGSGLGTYRYVYGPFQQRLDGLWYYHAENQYLEVLVEQGIVGLGLMLGMIGLVGAASWRLLRHGPDVRTVALGVAGAFALSGQAIHAVFDFALYIPANLLLFALLCGALSGRAAMLARQRPAARPSLGARLRFLAPLLAGSLLAAVAWGGLETRRAAAIETALKETRFSEAPDGATAEELLGATKRLGRALEHREDDAEAQYRMAQLWIQLYRVRALEQLRAEDIPGADDQSLWQLTSPVVLHGRAHQFARDNLCTQLERLRAEPVVSRHLTHAVRHLVLAHRGCPLLANVELLTAALAGVATEPAGDGIYLERVRQLAPADPDLLFRCGVLEMNAGRRDRAYESWRRCLALSPRYVEAILQSAGPQMTQPETIERLLPDSPELLIRVAREKYAVPEYAEVRKLLTQRARRLIEQGAYPEDERCYLRGSALALEGLYAQAIGEYCRAVGMRGQDAGWRYELARALKHEGRLGDAWEQAKVCVRLEPNKHEYRTLLEEINHLRLTTSTHDVQ